jgi:hypothetical protein
LALVGLTVQTGEWQQTIGARRREAGCSERTTEDEKMFCKDALAAMPDICHDVQEGA